MESNVFLAQALANYIFAVRGQPAVFCGPGMICDPSVLGSPTSIKNGLMPVRYTKFWASFTRAAAATDPFVLDTTQTLNVLSSGVGDSATPNGWTGGNLTLGDTNLPAGGALAETGYVFFLIGLSISTEAVVIASANVEIVGRGILTNPIYVSAMVETVIDMGVLTATSDDGNDMRLGLINLYQQVGGAVGGGVGSVARNGGLVSLPGTFMPFARPLACGDKNSGNKLVLKITFPRARSIDVNETLDIGITATGGVSTVTPITNEPHYVKGTILFYGIQLCMPDVLQCGVPTNFPGSMGGVQQPGNPTQVGQGSQLTHASGYPSY